MLNSTYERQSFAYAVRSNRAGSAAFQRELTAAGTTLGIGAAHAATRLLSALLFGVGPSDPVTYVVVSAVLAAVSLVAMYLPAHRASRVDPIIALRADG